MVAAIVVLLGVGVHYGLTHKMVIVKGESMSPTMHDSDMIVLRTTAPTQGKIVVFRTPPEWGFDTKGHSQLVKRIVATSGSTVQFRNGEIFVNGSRIDRGVSNCSNWKGTVPEGTILVAGDNTTNSIDSVYRICNKLPSPFVPVDSIMFSGDPVKTM